MAAVAGQIVATSRHQASPVRIERRMPNRLIETQPADIGVNHLHMHGVRVMDASGRIVNVEQRQGRIEGDNALHNAARHPFAGQTGDMAAQTVADDRDAAEQNVRLQVEEVDERTDDRTDSDDARLHMRVLAVRSLLPVDGDAVEFAQRQIGGSQPRVDSGLG